MRNWGMLVLFLALIWAAGCEDDCAVCPEVEAPVEQEPCGGNAWHVPQNYPTITEALAVAAAGDTVFLASGIYNEHGMTLPSGLVLMGTGTEEDPVIIDAGGQGRIFSCSEADSLIVLNGLTLTGGYLSGDDDDGAALRCGESHLRIMNCTFEGNHTATGDGGGIYVRYSTLELENCLFQENVASNGGSGMYASEGDCLVRGCVFRNNTGSAATLADGAHVLQCTFKENEGRGLTVRNDCFVENCSFIENVVYGNGAGLQGWSGLEIVGSIFLRNQAYGVYNSEGHGGGLFVYHDNLMVTGCEFIDNRANGQGGGISCENLGVIQDTRFDGNHADSGGGISGRSSLEISHCDLINNRGDSGATAISCMSATLESCALVGNVGPFWTIYTSDASVLRQCTIAANEVDPTGSVLYFGYRDPVSHLTDCIIAFNGGIPVDESSTIPVLEYCDIFGNAEGDWVGVVADQAGVDGNFSLDPLFCHLSLGNVSLCADSPCLPPGTGHDEVVGARGGGCASCGD